MTATGMERLSGLGWNVSGYIAHMTDNTRIWAERLVGVARGADARVIPYDPDLLAQARRYDTVAIEGATWSLRIAVAIWLRAVDEADSAEVVIVHSERGLMELSDVVASNAHDAFHHCWDLTRILRSGRASHKTVETAGCGHGATSKTAMYAAARFKHDTHECLVLLGRSRTR